MYSRMTVCASWANIFSILYQMCPQIQSTHTYRVSALHRAIQPCMWVQHGSSLLCDVACNSPKQCHGLSCLAAVPTHTSAPLLPDNIAAEMAVVLFPCHV